MEREGYRENLELLREHFPGRGCINMAEAADFLGVEIKTVHAAIQNRTNPLPTKKVGTHRVVIPLALFARWLTCK